MIPTADVRPGDHEGRRPWTAFYPASTPREITEPPFRNLADLITASASLYGSATAFTMVMPNGMFGNLTFAEVDRLSDAFAVYLREVAGLAAGDRVALQVPNGLASPVASFGIFKAGCVLVNTNPLYTAEEMARQFADASPKALVICDMFADKLPEVVARVAIPNIIITRVAEFMPPMVRTVIGRVQRHWDRSVRPVEVAHLALPQAIAAGEAHQTRAKIAVSGYTAQIGPQSLAALQYTGGTTGISKGAMLTHGNIVMNMAQAMSMVQEHVRKGEETILTAIPTYHILAFTINLMGFFWVGGRNILVPNPRPLSNLKRAFENYRINWIVGVNTLFNGLMNEFWFSENPPKSLKASLSGGMALQGAVAERWLAMTGTPVIEGYGLTETSPVVTFNPIGRAREGAIGVPVPSTEVRLLTEQGQRAAPGEAGEIAVRGPQVMAGYWNRPDETAKVMTEDGFFRTGDIGTMDPDGFVRVVDRKKDMILVSGFNVYPNEIEDCLARLPGVQESAVIGVPDGAAGEAVKAYIIRRDPLLTSDEVRAHCKRTLTGYKVPKHVEFRDELPKSNVGKILRRALRDEVAGPDPIAVPSSGKKVA